MGVACVCHIDRVIYIANVVESVDQEPARHTLGLNVSGQSSCWYESVSVLVNSSTIILRTFASISHALVQASLRVE